jgi:LDH2 family malate/lactate/ureidoglycolate dehydrogenase
MIIDISVSSVANGVVSKAYQQNKRLPGKWILDNQGIATDDPKAYFTDPPGTVLPLRGEILGYKGYALGLLVEALTAGLSGHGRSNDPDEWGASVFLQIINPDAFGGLAHYLREMDWLGNACTDSTSKNSSQPVRLPGSRGLLLKKEPIKNGVELEAGIIKALKKLSKKYEIDMVAANRF